MWHRKNEQIIKTETMEKKTINDLVDAIQQIRPEPREKVENFVREFFNVIRRALIRERFVKVKGLGTFKLVDVSPRESVDVNTGERIEIEGHLKVTFTPDNAMRDAVNRPFAHLQAFVINEGTDIEEMSRTDGFKLDEETEFSEALPNQDVVKPEYDSAKAATSNADSKDDEVVDFVVEENVNDIPKKKETPAVTQTQEVTAENGEDNSDGSDKKTDENSNDEAVTSEVAESRESSNTEERGAIPEADERTMPVTEDEESEVLPIKTTRRWLKITLLSLSGVLLLVVGYLAGHYRLLTPNSNMQPEKVAPVVPAVKVPVKQSPKPKPMVEAKKDTVRTDSVKETTVVKQKPVEPVVKKPKPVVPIVTPEPGDEYIITGVKGIYKLQPGEGLYRVARREYGNKSFIKYILKLNEFPNPDNIPVGTEIKLPKLVERGNSTAK